MLSTAGINLEVRLAHGYSRAGAAEHVKFEAVEAISFFHCDSVEADIEGSAAKWVWHKSDSCRWAVGLI